MSKSNTEETAAREVDTEVNNSTDQAKSAESLKRKLEESKKEMDEAKRKPVNTVTPEEWIDAWKRDSTGFHEGVPNL